MTGGDAFTGRLYLSPRTIGSQLYRIFPELDITSRTQLASRLNQLDHTQRQPGPGQPRCGHRAAGPAVR